MEAHARSQPTAPLTAAPAWTASPDPTARPVSAPMAMCEHCRGQHSSKPLCHGRHVQNSLRAQCPGLIRLMLQIKCGTYYGMIEYGLLHVSGGVEDNGTLVGSWEIVLRVHESVSKKKRVKRNCQAFQHFYFCASIRRQLYFVNIE